MAAVEMAAVQHAFAFGIDDRIVVGAVEFVFDRLAQPRQRIGQHADHMGRAADRIAILQPLAVVPTADRIGRSWRSQAATRCWPGCGLTENSVASKWCGIAVQRERRQCR